MFFLIKLFARLKYGDEALEKFEEQQKRQRSKPRPKPRQRRRKK
jgi:hypothetical protein